MEKIPVKIAAPAGAIVAGIILAVFGVQKWIMPTPLAILILVILFGLLALFIGSLLRSGITTILQWKERRATSATWITNEAPGLLDCEVDGKRALDRLSEEFRKWEDDTQRLAKQTATYSRKMSELENGKRIKAKTKQQIANRLGRQIDRSAIYIEKRTELFKKSTNAIVRNYGVWIEALNVKHQKDKPIVQYLTIAFEDFAKAGIAAIKGVQSYKKGAQSLTQSNLTKMIRGAGVRLNDSLDAMLNCFSQFRDDCSRLHEELLLKSNNLDSSIPDKEGSQKK